jgi:hypothetical protein
MLYIWIYIHNYVQYHVARNRTGEQLSKKYRAITTQSVNLFNLKYFSQSNHIDISYSSLLIPLKLKTFRLKQGCHLDILTPLSMHCDKD